MAPRTTSAAARKRKRDSSVATCSPNKQRRQAVASSSASANTSSPTYHAEHQTDDEAPSTQEWPARRILAETARKYLVEWEDNSQTGERYDPTWEWKKGVSKGLVQEWKDRQAAEEAARAQALLRKRGSGTRTRPVARPSTPPSTGDRCGGEAQQTSSHSLASWHSSPFIEDSPSPSSSGSYRPSTQEVTGSASTQQPAHSGHETSAVGTTQEATISRASISGHTTLETAGSSTLVPTASSRQTGDILDTSHQAGAGEISQGSDHLNSHSQDTHCQIREIPESPAQEEPHSFPQPTCRRPQAPAITWRSFEELSTLEHISTQADSSGLSLTQRSLPEFRWFGAHQTPERQLQQRSLSRSPKNITPQTGDQANRPPELEAPNSVQANLVPLSTSAEPHPPGQPQTSQASNLGNGTHQNSALNPQEDSTFSSTDTSTNEYTVKQVEKQHAQVVTYISTQDYSLADVHPTTEECESTDIKECNAATPKSRHDSSQESPIRSQFLFLDSVSAIAQPPSSSLQALDSVPPPRPQTPITVSSLSQRSVMSANITPERQKLLDEENEKMRLKLEEAVPTELPPPFVSKSVLRRQQKLKEEAERRAAFESASATPVAATPAVAAGPSTYTPQGKPPDTRTSEQASGGEGTSHMQEKEPQPEASPLTQPATETFDKEAAGPVPTISTPSAPTDSGTRSPSSIADRSPPRPEPPSLRTEALINSAAVHVAELPSLGSHSHHVEVHHDAEQPATGPEEVSDFLSGDEDSVIGYGQQEYHDADLGLSTEEYMVPLPMLGFQKSATNQEIIKKRDLLDAFLDDVNQPAGKIEEIKVLLERLKSIETHVDLVFAESGSQDLRDGEGKQYLWSSSNSAKFVFLGSLLDELRDRTVHVIIVLKDGDEALFRLLENALRVGKHNFKSPGRGKSANFSQVQGHLLVTLLSADSPNVVRPPDVIICIDSVGMATDIRKKHWARNPDRERAVPILDLMVPDSVSHIDFCLTKDWDPLMRLHTIITTLSQLSENSRRSPMDTPQAIPAGQLVAQYIMDLQEAGEEAPVWPLPSIHSIKDVVETVEQSTQLTQEKFSTQPTPAPKRLLDDIEMQIDEPSKRPRLSAHQEIPEHLPSNSADQMEITHITDSMPGTALSPSARRPQRQPVTTSNGEMELVPRGTYADYLRLREAEKAWEPRQHEHEIVSSSNRDLQQELQKARNELETAARNRAILNQRIDKLRDENSDLRRRFKEQEDLNLMSKEDQVAEITRLRQKLHEAETTRDKAVQSKANIEQNWDYLRDSLSDAQKEAEDWKRQYEELAAKQPSLEALAHGQTKELKRIHYSTCEEDLRDENGRLKRENAIQKKLIEQKEQEVAKYKSNGRGGYSTRQSSVPRSPRVGSRGGSRPGSPAPTGRDRVMHLRNG